MFKTHGEKKNTTYDNNYEYDDDDDDEDLKVL